MRLLFASAFNIKNVKRIKLNSNNIFLFNYLKYKNKLLKNNRKFKQCLIFNCESLFRLYYCFCYRCR